MSPDRLDRRQFIVATTTTTIAAIAGCATPQSSTLDYTFSRLDTPPDTTHITNINHTQSTTTITIHGVITGKNGCMSARVASPPTLTNGTNTQLRATIETYHTGGDACTQVITHIGYALTITYPRDTHPDAVTITERGYDTQSYTLPIPYLDNASSTSS